MHHLIVHEEYAKDSRVDPQSSPNPAEVEWAETVDIRHFAPTALLLSAPRPYQHVHRSWKGLELGTSE